MLHDALHAVPATSSRGGLAAVLADHAQFDHEGADQELLGLLVDWGALDDGVLEDGMCPCCGDRLRLDVFEVFGGHHFQFDACCGDLHERIVWAMNEDPDFSAALMRALDVEGLTGNGLALRRVADDGYGIMLLDWTLSVKPIAQKVAKDFVRRHHEHCPPPAGWRFGAGVWNGYTLVGVVMVGRPVARAYDPARIVEVNRLCVQRALPDALRWKACSTLYTWAAEEAARRGFARIITYTLEEETGMTLRYARWKRDALTKGGSWNSPSRPRVDKAPTGRKVRWFRDLAAPR